MTQSDFFVTSGLHSSSQWLLTFLADIASLDFAKIVLLSIVRFTLSGQRYHRCQLSLLLLKSTCSHLVKCLCGADSGATRLQVFLQLLTLMMTLLSIAQVK